MHQNNQYDASIAIVVEHAGKATAVGIVEESHVFVISIVKHVYNIDSVAYHETANVGVGDLASSHSFVFHILDRVP